MDNLDVLKKSNQKEFALKELLLVQEKLKTFRKSEDIKKWRKLHESISADKLSPKQIRKATGTIVKMQDSLIKIETDLLKKKEIKRMVEKRKHSTYHRLSDSYKKQKSKALGVRCDSYKKKICLNSFPMIEEEDIQDKEFDLKCLLQQLTQGNISNGAQFLFALENSIGTGAFTKLKELFLADHSENVSRKVYGSWHQGETRIFNSRYAGKQCCAMALAFIMMSKICPMKAWTTDAVDVAMFEGQILYMLVLKNSQELSIEIPRNGFLLVNNFDVLSEGFRAFDSVFNFYYENDPEIFGNLCDVQCGKENSIGFSLFGGLEHLFNSYTAGILIADERSYAVIKSDEKFYFCDSHESYDANDGKGPSCVIECDSLEKLYQVCRSATGQENKGFTLDHIVTKKL